MFPRYVMLNLKGIMLNKMLLSENWRRRSKERCSEKHFKNRQSTQKKFFLIYIQLITAVANLVRISFQILGIHSAINYYIMVVSPTYSPSGILCIFIWVVCIYSSASPSLLNPDMKHVFIKLKQAVLYSNVLSSIFNQIFAFFVQGPS